MSSSRFSLVLGNPFINDGIPRVYFTKITNPDTLPNFFTNLEFKLDSKLFVPFPSANLSKEQIKEIIEFLQEGLQEDENEND